MGLGRIALLSLFGLAVASASAGAEAHVSGSATYRERVALPAGAVFETVLEDVSQADAPAVEIARIAEADPGNPPFAFEIPYDPAAIDPARRYAVRARVTADGQLMFISDEAHPVLTGGAPDTVDIVMRMMPAAPKGARPSAPALGAHGLRLPATFAGDFPCPDCEALRWQLSLWNDQAFHLRREWVGTDRREDRIGRWGVEPAQQALTLSDGVDDLKLTILGPDRLRLLDLDGAPIASDANYELTAKDEVEPLEAELALRGMVTYMADTARFTECLTGREFPLVAEGDYAALEHAYLAAGAEAGTPLMASFDGAIVERPEADGEGSERAVLVERFIGVWPGETCERAMAPASLTDTYWKVLRLGDQEVVPGDGRREPHLILHAGEARFNATVGCNQMAGGYALDGDRLSFGQAASTMMACPAPLDAWEQALGQSLTTTRSWRVDGQTLELFGEDGAPLALFQAVYLP
jgi:uncharacterized lipoprotein YbaY/heat shock protein HslJ/uncharacterized lipoprotein NlpE involved in copper resistance